MKKKKNNRKYKKTKKGFTLVELLAVIVILGILLAVSIPAITILVNKNREKTFISNAQMCLEAAMYEMNFPTSTKFSDGKLSFDEINSLLEKKLINSPYGASYSKNSFIKNNNNELYIVLKDTKGNSVIGTKDSLEFYNDENDIISSLGLSAINDIWNVTYEKLRSKLSSSTIFEETDGSLRLAPRTTDNNKCLFSDFEEGETYNFLIDASTSLSDGILNLKICKDSSCNSWEAIILNDGESGDRQIKLYSFTAQSGYCIAYRAYNGYTYIYDMVIEKQQ